MEIRTRWAPSPTGLPHAGNYRTALFAYFFAKKQGGKFYLRIEDTDRKRSKKEYETNIIESLKWFNLSLDKFGEGDGIYRQSENIAYHEKTLKQLIDQGNAYISKEAGEDGVQKEIVRFKNPNIDVTFTDLIRGPITFNTTELGDFVIAKSVNEPLFHHAVVADDIAMGITHIVRGEDHISNTPRQILISRALGAPDFIYAHLPLLMSSDRTKLSKRKGATPMISSPLHPEIIGYRERGYLPEALINFMAFLGWNPGDDREIMSVDELINEFDLARVQKSAATFNEEKLQWYNKHYLQKPENEKYIAQMIADAKTKYALTQLTETGEKRLINVLRNSIATLNDLDVACSKGDFAYLQQETVQLDVSQLIWKKGTKEETIEHLNFAAQELETYTGNTTFNDADLTAYASKIMERAEKLGKGNVLWPIRYAITGKASSPDWKEVLAFIPPKIALARITHAKQILQS